MNPQDKKRYDALLGTGIQPHEASQLMVSLRSRPDEVFALYIERLNSQRGQRISALFNLDTP